jgi:hypothetical protein
LWATVAAGAVLIAALLFLAWIFDSPDEQPAPIDSTSVVGLL